MAIPCEDLKGFNCGGIFESTGRGVMSMNYQEPGRPGGPGSARLVHSSLE